MNESEIRWTDGLSPSQSEITRDIRIADEMDRQRAQREARRRLDAEERGPIEVPTGITLRQRLAESRPPLKYRIDGWLPMGCRVMLAAQFKAGKTTLVGNLVRSLVDGDPFLERDTVLPIDGDLAIIDTEMSAQLWDWLEAQRIREDGRVRVFPLRGRVASFNLLDPGIRSQWAQVMREAGVSFVVLDCLRPVLDSLGLDEHRDAGRFLVAFDAWLAEAGIAEAVIVLHMGHTGERARGDSRLRDWPDVEWRLVRQDDDPSSARYVSAFGRDVDQKESRLHFDLIGRRLSIGDGSRRDAAASAALDDVLTLLDGDPLSSRAIERAAEEAGLPHARNVIREAVNLGVRTGAIATEPGLRRAVLHRRGTTAPVRRSAPTVRRSSESECASASIARRTHTHSDGQSSAPVFDPSEAFGPVRGQR